MYICILVLYKGDSVFRDLRTEAEETADDRNKTRLRDYSQTSSSTRQVQEARFLRVREMSIIVDCGIVAKISETF
jgi:hypothetical protein